LALIVTLVPPTSAFYCLVYQVINRFSCY